MLHWCQVYKLPALSLRLFNVYGPRARTSGTYGAVFGVFLAQLAASKPITVVGDGAQPEISPSSRTLFRHSLRRPTRTTRDGSTMSAAAAPTASTASSNFSVPKRWSIFPSVPANLIAPSPMVRASAKTNWQATIGFEEGVQPCWNMPNIGKTRRSGRPTKSLRRRRTGLSTSVGHRPQVDKTRSPRSVEQELLTNRS